MIRALVFAVLCGTTPSSGYPTATVDKSGGGATVCGNLGQKIEYKLKREKIKGKGVAMVR